MDEETGWANRLTDPPCRCGNDLGLGIAQPNYVPGSARIARLVLGGRIGAS